MTLLREKTAVTRVVPRCSVPGGRVTLSGSGFNGRLGNTPSIRINGEEAHICCARSKLLTVTVPEAPPAESATLSIGEETLSDVDLQIGSVIARDVHPVDNPAVDSEGNVYTTLSGRRGEKTPVSVFRISNNGLCEPYLTDIMNPTSLAFGPDGALYVSSRHSGMVYRAVSQAEVSVYADGLGTATGIAFDREGTLFVGDRCGTIYRVSPNRTVTTHAQIPPSVAAFHLCIGPDDALYVTNPDISTYDAILRIPAGSKQASVFYPGIKRPQGMAFDEDGNLYVAKAMAGDSGIVRVTSSGKAMMIVSGPILVGVAFDDGGDMILAGADSLYRLKIGIAGRPYFLTSPPPEPKIRL